MFLQFGPAFSFVLLTVHLLTAVWLCAEFDGCPFCRKVRSHCQKSLSKYVYVWSVLVQG